MAKSWQDASRVVWHTTTGDERGLYVADAVQPEQRMAVGCLQRIADATEKMAESYDQMRDIRDYWQREATRLLAERDTLARSNRALRAVIRRMKEASNG